MVLFAAEMRSDPQASVMFLNHTMVDITVNYNQGSYGYHFVILLL